MTPLIIENLLYEPQEIGILAWPWLRITTAGLNGAAWYDLAEDPGAQRPLAPPAGSAGIKAQADSLLQAWGRLAVDYLPEHEVTAAEVPEDIKRRLKALGY